MASPVLQLPEQGLSPKDSSTASVLRRGVFTMECIMPITVQSLSAQRLEIDQRSRATRLQLEQLEMLLLPRIRLTRSFIKQGVYPADVLRKVVRDTIGNSTMEQI